MNERTVQETAGLQLKEIESPKGAYAYARYGSGTQGLLLPYRRKLGAVQYLLRRALIPSWDSHTDICGIAVNGESDQVEALLGEALNAETGYGLKPGDLKSLGVCACDRRTDTTCYLYAVDLSRRDPAEEKLSVAEEMTFWGTEEDVLESLDSQLIACLAKLKYMVL